MAFLTAISYSTDTLAATCAENESPTSSCDSLVINTNFLTINIPAGTYAGDVPIDNFSEGLDLTISQGALIEGGIIGLLNRNIGNINSITNLGTMSGLGGFGIRNDNAIGTLNNLQGATTLTYGGALPLNYNIIIGTGATSTTGFGKIAFTNPTGETTFGISLLSGSNIGVAGTRYQNVISSLASANITNEDTLLTYTNGQATATYKLVVDDGNVADTWDLLIESMSNGPSATDTQSSLKTLAPRLRGSFNSVSAMANFPTSNTYDCNLFDVKGMCISAGGRYSTVDNPSSNSSAAVVTLGYKVSPNIRIGGFLYQIVTNNTPTGINISNKNPMMGGFLYWNQNADGLGYQVKIANAYQDKDLSTTRDVIGTSEAGRGNTSLNTRSYVSELSYAFMYKENTLVRPYFALRHTSIEQDAYTETGIATPLTYSALNDKTTSALMGVKFKHALTPKTNLIGSLGLEQDIHNKTDQLRASGVSGLTSENFSGDIHRTRPVASLGATYDIAKSQRLSGELLVQQLPFQSTAGATAYFNYMIGF